MNQIILASSLAWVLTQFTKILCGLFRYGLNDKSRFLWRLIWAGGMPSAHSALITSCALTVFLKSGPQSLIFGLSLVMACVVMYDRSRMYAIYQTFQNKYPALKEEVQNDPLLNDLVGHRPQEILVGILIGLASGILVNAF